MGTCAAREALGTETLRLAACAVEMLRGGGRAEERTGSERVIRCVGTASSSNHAAIAAPAAQQQQQPACGGGGFMPVSCLCEIPFCLDCFRS